jgi:hypothetical protein
VCSGLVVDLDADHDRGFVADPPVHCVSPSRGRACGSGRRPGRTGDVSADAVVCQGVEVRREWDLNDLVASWTLVDADQEQLVKLHLPSRLSFALMVKFFEIEGRFPRHAGELTPATPELVPHPPIGGAV